MSSLAEQRAAIAPLARAELARRRLADFLGLILPSYDDAPHEGALRAPGGSGARARSVGWSSSCRRGTAKSEHASRGFPAWYLGRRPDERVVLASYAAELAEAELASSARTPARSALAVPRRAVSAESAAVNRWDTTKGGGVIAAGVRGGLTGHGANLLIVDDPVKDREEADTEAIRNSPGRGGRRSRRRG